MLFFNNPEAAAAITGARQADSGMQIRDPQVDDLTARMTARSSPRPSGATAVRRIAVAQR